MRTVVPLFGFAYSPATWSLSCPVAVGQDEEPFALVWGADLRRREEAFRDAVAKAFEVGANNVEVSEPKVSAHVFEEAPIWSALIDDSAD